MWPLTFSDSFKSMYTIMLKIGFGKAICRVIPWLSLFLGSKSLTTTFSLWGQRTIIHLSVNKYHVCSHPSPVTSRSFYLGEQTRLQLPFLVQAIVLNAPKLFTVGVDRKLDISALMRAFFLRCLIPSYFLSYRPKKTASSYAHKTAHFNLIFAFRRETLRNFWDCPTLERPPIHHITINFNRGRITVSTSPCTFPWRS